MILGGRIAYEMHTLDLYALTYVASPISGDPHSVDSPNYR